MWYIVDHDEPKRPRILLLEDDPLVGPFIEHVLLDAGYRVHFVGTVAEAQSQLDSRTYDLVVADERLPDGSGLTIADAAKDRGIKTLVVTGCALEFPAEHLRHEYLMKPVRPAELLSVLKLTLGEGPE